MYGFMKYFDIIFKGLLQLENYMQTTFSGFFLLFCFFKTRISMIPVSSEMSSFLQAWFHKWITGILLSHGFQFGCRGPVIPFRDGLPRGGRCSWSAGHSLHGEGLDVAVSWHSNILHLTFLKILAQLKWLDFSKIGTNTYALKEISWLTFSLNKPYIESFCKNGLSFLPQGY